MKKLMLGLMMAFAVTAEARPIDGIEYEFNFDGTATITGYDWGNPPTKVDVAEVEDDGGEKYTVTSVGADAFSGCGLTSVSLPNATTIGRSVFFMCEKLTSVYLPNATTIGENAFAWCDSLTSVSLPNATTIGGYAFNTCQELTSVSLPNATTIEEGAFQNCQNLTFVSLPSATTIGKSAFFECYALSVLVVNDNMKSTLEAGRLYYHIPDSTVIATELLSEEVVRNAGYEVQEAVVETNLSVVVSTDVKVQPSVTLKSGDTVLNEAIYEASCAYYGCTPLTKPETPEVPAKPTAEDFKVVSKDAQVVQEDEVAVKKESIAAPSAGTVKVEDNKVQLGVTVLKTSDLTAEKKDWGEVTLTADDVKVENGKIVISVPVDSASGFMILQSGDAKVSDAAVTHEPWYTPTVED